MALPTTQTAQGATFALSSSSWASGILGIALDGQEIPVKDVTNLATTGFRQMKFGSLTNPGTLQLRFQFNPDEPPPLGTVETGTLTWPLAAGGTTAANLAGTGAITAWSFDANGGDEEEVTGELTFTFNGDTGPTFTDAT